MSASKRNHDTPSKLQGDELAISFGQVDALLQKFKSFWQAQPIHLLYACKAQEQQELASILMPLMPSEPEDLAAAVGALSLPQIEHIDANADAQRAFFAPFFPDVFTQPWLVHSKSDSSQDGVTSQTGFPFWITNGIGGRKLGQIEAFIAHTPQITGTVVEWCAGKGHLGRLLSFARNPQAQPVQKSKYRTPPDLIKVVSLEWQNSLCAAGTQLARQFGQAQSFQQADVLSEAGGDALMKCDHAVALHACGDLHRVFLQRAAQADLRSVLLAPCCYHLTGQQTYQPMSQTAGRSGLSIARQDLKLAVQGQVTAGARVRQLRETEVTWRLAYQIMRERYTQASDYQPLPSVAKHWFSGAFRDFARFACEQHHWIYPSDVDWDGVLSEARHRYLQIKRLDLIRHVFRRPLELWLVLDRALFLQEQGYQVSLQAFCDYQLTPRNMLITALRR